MTPGLSAGVVAVYVGVWAAAHSLLASVTVKRWARRLLGKGVDRWYRLGFVIVAVVSLLPLVALWLILPDRQLYSVPALWRWLMVLGQLAALVALGVAVLQAGVMHFLGLAQLAADDPEATGVLQVHGFYQVTRHPLYLFSMILIWLTPVMTVKLVALYGAMSLYFVIGSYHEEQLLIDEYGQAYADYRKRVPRFLPWPGRCFGRDA